MASSKAQFIEAEKNCHRNKKLHEQNVISDLEFDAIQRAFDVTRLGMESADFQMESAAATHSEAKDNLARATILCSSNWNHKYAEYRSG